MATLTLNDLYKRYLRPAAGERECMRVLRAATVGWAILSASVAVVMLTASNSNVLDIWWEMAGVFSGGMLGLFLLGMCSRATSPAAAVATAVGILVILWMTFSPRGVWPDALGWARSPFHNLLITAIGTLAILLVGTAIRFATGRTTSPSHADSPTVPDARHVSSNLDAPAIET